MGERLGSDPVPRHVLTCAVAMATFNGARYLEEQLTSIGRQTRVPDEIIVADDGSTDDTLAIVRRMATTLPCQVTIIDEGRRLGPAGNFERALGRITSDVVFLSDQDDVWQPEKVATVMDRFERAPSVGGIFTNGSILSEDPKLRSASLWDTVGFTPRERRLWAQDPLRVLIRKNVVTGASVALRADKLPMLLPFPRGGWHDLSIAVLLASVSSLEPCPQSLFAYRLHQSNAAGLATGSRRSRAVNRMAHMANLDAQRTHWAELRAVMLAHGASAEALARVDAKIEHVGRRRTMPDGRLGRLRPAVRELATGGYGTYAAGRWSFVRDVVGP